MASEKNMRMEESGNGQQVIQEKIAQTMKMVTNLIKEKGITDDSSYRKSLHPEKMVSIHLLCQIRMTFVSKEY